MASRSNRVLTDHDEIRRWAEERNANPACVRGTGGNNDIGMLRLDFPGYTGAQSLEQIGWNDWFNKFDERGLALLVQDRTARGEGSNFNKLVSRETAAASGGRARKTARSAAGSRRTSARSRSQAKPRTRTATKKKSAAKKRAARTPKSTSRRVSAARSTRAKTTLSTSRRSGSTASSRSTRTRRTSATTRSTSARARGKTSTRASSRGSSGSRRNNVRSITSGRRSSSAHVLTDHNEIRRWAEERKAAPACVRGTGGGNDPGMIRLDFPGFSGARSLEHIDWNKWFRAFDDNNLALLVQNTRSGGGRSNFNKLIARESDARRASEKRTSSRSSAGSRAMKKETRGSTRARRTESARGRTTSQRRAA